MLGLGTSVVPDSSATSFFLEASLLAKFKTRVIDDGGSVESYSCMEQQLVPLLLEPTTFTTGLLEFYPNAAAAYSLRQLRRSVSPYAIRVRRSDDTEQDIGFNSNGELDTNALLDFADGGDVWVSVWYDQSSNGNDATQSTPSYQPKIVSSGLIIAENGKPAIQTDGSDDTLALASTISFTDLTWFTVTKKDDIYYSNSIIFFGTSSAYGGDDVNDQGNPRLDVPATSIIANTLGNTSASGGEINQHLSYYNRNGTNASGGLNGEVNTEATVITTAFNLTTFFEFSSLYRYKGLVQELVLYDSSKKSNRTGIETNINDYYNIY